MKKQWCFILAALMALMIMVMGGCGGGSSSSSDNNSGGGGGTTSYSISGAITVNGSGLAGVTVTLSDSSSKTTTTDSIGNYSFSSIQNGSYTVTPALTGYTFTQATLAATVSGANLTGKNFTATTTAAGTYSISGTITNNGAALAGVTVTLSGSGSTTATTDNSGNYTFSGAQNGSYTIAPSISGYTFTPTSQSVTVNGANLAGNNFTATTSAANTYSISGTITSGGTALAGVTVNLSGSGSTTATTDSSGNYSFSGAQNGSYTITPNKTGYTFAPANIAVTVNAANLIGKSFTAGAANPFISTGIMNVTRQGHSATLLPNGKVLIVGGDYFSTGSYSSTSYHSTSEIYDPASGTFTLSGNTISSHDYHTATLLSNGKVLIAGGQTWAYTGGGGNSGIASSSAEIYDPVTGTFSATGSMLYVNTLALGHTATLLNNGKVLFTGTTVRTNQNNYYPAIGEIYDPATGVFTWVANLNSLRQHHAATLLSNGKVLITGGYNNFYEILNTSETYDPVSGNFSAAANMNALRYSHTATRLADGNVLITGGMSTSAGPLYSLATSEYYDPTAGAFTSTGSMSTSRAGQSDTMLANGKVLIVGDSTAEIYDPITRVFTSAGNMGATLSTQTATTLNNGNVLIVGAGNKILLYQGL